MILDILQNLYHIIRISCKVVDAALQEGVQILHSITVYHSTHKLILMRFLRRLTHFFTKRSGTDFTFN